MIGAQPFLGFVVGRASSTASGSATRCSRSWAFGAHATIGFALPLLAFIHGWQSMSLPESRSTSSSGLWIVNFRAFSARFASHDRIVAASIERTPASRNSLSASHGGDVSHRPGECARVLEQMTKEKK